MRLGIEFEYNSRKHDPVANFAISVTIPWKTGNWWGWRTIIWRKYL